MASEQPKTNPLSTNYLKTKELTMDKQTKLLHDLWKTAGRTETVLTIPCGTKAGARRLRFAMYNAVKPLREGKIVDEELTLAVQNCSIGFAEGDDTQLEIRQKIQTEVMQVIAGLVDPAVVRAAPAVSKEDAEIAEGQRKLLELMGTGELAPAERVTPYYTRSA